jgi:DNA-binding NarL/FixJ family response regulator
LSAVTVIDSTTRPLHVALADDSYLVREALRHLLTPVPDIELVAVCGDAEGLLAAVDREAPDVVLSDIRMPPRHEREGIRVAAQLRATHPEIGVVLLSQYEDPTYALELFESGSEGRAYLLKERIGDLAELVDAIQAVADGRSVIDAKIIDALITERGRPQPSSLDELTAREREVLGGVAAGKSNTAIACSLSLTKRAVEKHINAIFMKLGLYESDDVSRRVKAALIYLAS